MADFSFLSDTDDEAVDRILAEARDHVVLEQVAAINLSGITDSSLPSHLEHRFSRLKTFPSSSAPSSSTTAAAASTQNPQLTSVKTLPTQPDPDTERVIDTSSSADDKLTNQTRAMDVSQNKFEDPDRKSGGSKNRKPRSSRRRDVPSSPSSFSSASSLENKSPIPSPTLSKGMKKKKRDDGFEARKKVYESSSDSDLPSPPRMMGCLWCSPKKPASKSRSKSFSSRWRRGGVEMEDDEFDWECTDEVLKDMNSFSFKEQKKILRKAVEEQNKISREAEKIVKLARQASARMDAGHQHAIGRDSDDEGLSD